MKKIITLFVFLLIASISFSQSRADFYWSGNSGSSDNIDQGDNWFSASNPSSGDNLYFNNTTGTRHWPYSNYGAGSYFGNIITYSGAGGIKWRGDDTEAYKFENNSDPTLFEVESNIGNRAGSNLELNPVGSGGVKVTGNVTIEASRTLNVYGTNQLEVTGVISGSSSDLVIHDAATVILSGTNTYTGTTTVSAGTLRLQGNLASSTITVASGAKLEIDGTLSVNSIVNNGTVELLSGSSLTINGNFTDNGTFTHNDRPVTFGGSSGQTTIGGDANTNFYSATISNTAGVVTNSGKELTFGTEGMNDAEILIVLSGSSFTSESSGDGHIIHGSVVIHGNAIIKDGSFFDITKQLKIKSTGDLQIQPGGELTVDGATTQEGTFTLQSLSATTVAGSFIPGGAVAGSVTVQRYITGHTTGDDGWHHISSPIETFSVSGSILDPGNPSTNDLYSWQESDGMWLNYKATSFSNIEAGKGYLTAWNSNVTKEFYGTLNNSNIPFTDLDFTDASAFTGWHLLGNPFQSAVLWNTTSWNKSASVNATAKVWNESTAAYIDRVQNDPIPAMQGFMIYVSSGTNSITIPTADRDHNIQNWYKNTGVNHIKLTAYDVDGGTAQESNIRINPEATTGFDMEYDSYFLAGYAPMFYSATTEGALSTNSIPGVTWQTNIPMGFIKNSSSTYYIEAEGVNNLEPQETVYLTDLKTNNTQILNDNPRYDFTSEEGDAIQRFIIHFSPLSVNDIILSEQINVFAADNKVEIRSNKPIDATINIYNIAGQLIATSQLNNESSTSLNIEGYKGAAIVSIITSGQTITEKVIVW